MVYVVSCTFGAPMCGCIEWEVDTLNEVESVLRDIAAQHGEETILEWIASGDLTIYEP